MSLNEDYSNWYKDKLCHMPTYTSLTAFGFSNLVEMLPEGPKKIDLMYYLELYGDKYSIEELTEAFSSYHNEFKAILMDYVQIKQKDLLKIWIES